MKPAWIVVALALALNAAAVLVGNRVEGRATPYDFEKRYLPIARGISEGGDFLLDGRAPSPPVYPLALAGISELGRLFHTSDENAARTFNVLAMALLAMLFYSLVRRYMEGRTALFAALMWVTYPFGIYLSLLPGPEPLYLLSLTLAAWAVLVAVKAKPMPVLAAGMASALPMLVKPMALFLPLGFLVFLMAVWTRKRVSLSCFALSFSLFVVGLLVVVMPWEAYLWHRTGRLIPVADLAGTSMHDGWTFGLKPGAGGDLAHLPGEVRTFMIEVEKISAGKGSGEVLNAVMKAAGERPGAFLKLLLIKAGRCWYGTDEMWHEGKTLAFQALYLVLSLIGAVIWLRGGRPGGTLAAVLSCLLLYHWAAATAALSILRYMVPAGFLMALMVAMAITQWHLWFCECAKGLDRRT